MSSARQLRAIRLAAGLTVRAQADRAGIPHSRIAEYEQGRHEPGLERADQLARAAGVRFIPVPAAIHASTAAEIGHEIRDVLEEKGVRAEDRAFRLAIQLHDDLSNSPGYLVGALVAATPPGTGDRRFDALLAGIVELHLGLESLPLPPWVADPARTFEPSWVPDGLTTEAEAVPALLRHGVVVRESELASV